jgi:uncharacterized protein
MGEILRLVILTLIVWLVWRWLNQRDALHTRTTSETAQPVPPSTSMVKCAQCQLFLPTDDAFHFRDFHFCCQQHQHDYLVQHNTGSAT